MAFAYPRSSSSFTYGPVKCRRAADIPDVCHPELPPPPLPSPHRDTAFFPGYTVTTHLVPASYPRYSNTEPRKYSSTSYELSADEPKDSAPRAERQEWVKKRTYDLLDHRAKMKFLRESKADEDGPIQSFEPVLWNVVNRYARIDAPKDRRDIGLTVVACHANGLHKETFEPMFRNLIEQSRRRRTGFCIDEIWSMDSVNSGDSALINKEHLKDYFDWIDHARDIINFTENYVPTGPYQASDKELPILLERAPTKVVNARVTEGFKDRHVVGIGHSFGGCTMACAALSRPYLFLSLTLIDPVIVKQSDDHIYKRVAGALSRRQVWPSRDEARELMKKNAFYASWHPDVLEAFVQYALADGPGGTVHLKTDRYQEAVAFAENHVPVETWTALESLDERIKLRWIMAGIPTIGDELSMQNMVWRRVVNSSNVRLKDIGHLIVQEAPLQAAQETVYGWQVMIAEKQDPIWARLKL